MGSDRTDTSLKLPGILVPLYALTEEHITSVAGTDYTIGDPEPDAPSVDDTTALQLEMSGSYASTSTAYDVMAIRAGAPDAVRSGAGVKFRSSGGNWVAANQPPLLLQYLNITSRGEHPSLVCVNDGTLVVSYTTASDVTVDYRTTSGAWGNSTNLHSSAAPSCLCVLPDGTVFCYVLDTRLYVYRSDDDGATWLLQHSDGLGGSLAATAVRIRAERDNFGSVVLFTMTGTDASAQTTQYHSKDGVNFTSVVATDDCYVWDVRLINGLLHVIVGNHTTDDYELRRTASAAVSAWIANAVTIGAGTPGGLADWGGATICQQPGGRLLVSYDPGADILCAYSDDAGETWTSGIAGVGPVVAGSSSADPGFPSMVWTRGGVSLVCNDAGGAAGVTPTACSEFRFGGHTDVPLSADMRVVASNISIFNDWSDSFHPFATLANHGWTASDTGAPTRSLSAVTGEHITTAGGEAAVSEKDLGYTSGYGVYWTIVRVVAGTFTLYHDTAGNRVTIDITSTQIRAYDATGAASSYAAHSIDMTGGGYMFVACVLDDNGNKAIVKYHGIDSLTDGIVYDMWPMSAVAALTSMGVHAATTVAHRINLAASSEAYVLMAGVYGPNASTPRSGLADNSFSDTDLEPVAIPLSGSPLWLTVSAYLRWVSGIVRRDGVTHSFAATGPRPPRNVFPSRSPSPSRVWRTGSTPGFLTMALRQEVGGVGALAPAVLGIWFDGVTGVQSFDVSLNGGAATNVPMRERFDYASIGNGAFSGITTGTATSLGYVRRDQLAGWYFLSSDGSTQNQLEGNSEGILAYGTGATSAKRAILRTAGNLTGATPGTGYIYHPRALLLIHLGNATAVTTVKVTVNKATGFSYSDVGLIGVGEVQVIPVAADLNDSLILDDDARVVTAPDGSRHSTRIHRDRRRLTLQWVQSAHGVYQAYTSTSPDYVTTYTSGNPAATWEAVPLILQGAAESLAGRPGLWVPAITRQSAVNATEVIYSLGANTDMLWGRVVGGWRREALQYVGPRPTAQVWRVPTFTFEEEL